MRNRRRAHCAVLFIYLYFAIHFDSVIEEVDSLSTPTPHRPRPDKTYDPTLPRPPTYTLPLPAEYHYDKNYLIDVSVCYCSSSLTDRCICVSSERVFPELYENRVLPHVRTHARNHTRDSNARSFRSPGATNRGKRGLIYTI